MSNATEVERLATIQRDSGELRISLDDLNGARYVSIRMWVRQDDGTHVPTKTGVTIRPKEVLDVGKALRRAFDSFQADPALAGPSREVAAPPKPAAAARKPQHRTVAYCPEADSIDCGGRL